MLFLCPPEKPNKEKSFDLSEIAESLKSGSITPLFRKAFLPETPNTSALTDGLSHAPAEAAHPKIVPFGFSSGPFSRRVQWFSPASKTASKTRELAGSG